MFSSYLKLAKALDNSWSWKNPKLAFQSLLPTPVFAVQVFSWRSRWKSGIHQNLHDLVQLIEVHQTGLEAPG